MKCIKMFLFKRRLWKIMDKEHNLVREYCAKQDWSTTAKWLHRNKASFKAYRRVCKLNKSGV